VTGEHGAERPGTWEYYDRRAVEGARTIGHALAYWKGLGVEATLSEIEAEAAEVRQPLTCPDGESRSIRAKLHFESFGRARTVHLLFGETLVDYR
jgi:hypothetical protein